MKLTNSLAEEGVTKLALFFNLPTTVYRGSELSPCGFHAKFIHSLLRVFSCSKRLGGIKLDEEENGKEENKDEKIDFKAEEKKAKEQEKEIKEKKKADDLWASFMSDVGGPKPKPKTTPTASSGIGSLSSIKKVTARLSLMRS